VDGLDRLLVSFKDAKVGRAGDGVLTADGYSGMVKRGHCDSIAAHL
jgi:hypothetical protein